MKEAFIARLFSTPVVIYVLDNDLNILEDIKNEEYLQIDNDNATPSYQSSNLFILEKYPEVKEAVIKQFNIFKNSVMKYNDTSFKLTTSWATKTTKESYSHFHDHKNSFFSGVLYLNDGKDFAPLVFSDRNGRNTSFLIDPTEHNEFTSEEWRVQPQKNMIVFFPSSTLHKIGKHDNDEDRYSIAFNFFPQGKYGREDSQVVL